MRFASNWGSVVPPRGEHATEMTCPNCGGHAHMDRVANRVYGWHDACGWSGDLRVITTGDRQALEPWQHNAR